VTVNGRRVDVASYVTRPGDVIQVKNRPKSLQMVQAVLAESHRDVPDFLNRVEGPQPEGHVLRLPEFADVSIPVQPHLIVELCSK
jgi:small subunit ribosomal protein S4